ncbi:MAG: hypothetical protein KDD70_01625 [Bdellovibrionales bacterium]|nr:hypothetical protein [Bdellovibrionales bacterium]
MSGTIPQKLFFAIAQNVSKGDPTWGILIANEYLSPEDPLRQALLKRSAASAPNHPAFAAAKQGRCLRDLTAKERQELRLSGSTLQSQTHSLPKPRVRTTLSRTVREARFIASA